MKRFAFTVLGLAVAASSTGCCCGHLFPRACGGGYAAPMYGAPAPACGSCGYAPAAPYGVGPTGALVPSTTTAAVPYAPVPMYAALPFQPLPLY
jgi:hypothetical protein